MARSSDLAGSRVLIVEDELLVAMDLESMLVDEGFDVVEIACTVAAALDAVETHRPDAVMLDLNLDGEPTIAVAERLNSHDIPFVVATGFTGKRSLDPSLQRAPLVEKPWNQSDLLAKLSAVLRRG